MMNGRSNRENVSCCTQSLHEYRHIYVDSRSLPLALARHVLSNQAYQHLSVALRRLKKAPGLVPFTNASEDTRYPLFDVPYLCKGNFLFWKVRWESVHTQAV